MQSMAEHYLQQGFKQGFEQETRRIGIEITLNILTERFSNVDVNALKPKLEAITDLDRLMQLNINAAIAESFDAFQEALNAD